VQSKLIVQPVLQAEVDAQIVELGQALLVGVHRCALSQALFVRVDPVHASAVHDVFAGV
jgi:hypothetical protein